MRPTVGLRILALLPLLALRPDRAGTEERTARTERGTLGAGAPWAVEWTARHGGREGPVVLVVGGMHGNEPAGAHAARQIASWPVARGSLVVIPRANVLALEAGERETPGAGEATADLNRCFPRRAGDDPRGRLARALWAFVRDVDPDWLLDLHEGFHFTRIDGRSVGQSVIAASDPACRRAARRLVAAVDRAIDAPRKRFAVKTSPAGGSLARAAHERLGARSLILETTRRGQPLSRRARQHRTMVWRLLCDLSVLPPGAGPERLAAGARGGDAVPVGLWDARGADRASVRAVEGALEGRGFAVHRLGPEDVRGGSLRGLEVAVFAGGRGSVQGRALGPEGRAALRSWLAGGGGYAGIGAGAYLATRRYAWSLGVLDARVLDRAHWNRGRAVLELARAGPPPPESPFAWVEVPRRFPALYVNGPVLAPPRDGDPAGFVPLARFVDEVAENGAPRGVLPGAPAIACGRHGAGRVVASSPHLERREGSRALLRALVRAAAGRDAP